MVVIQKFTWPGIELYCELVKLQDAFGAVLQMDTRDLMVMMLMYSFLTPSNDC